MEERAALFAQNFAAMNVAPANETNLQLKSSKGIRDDLMACVKNVELVSYRVKYEWILLKCSYVINWDEFLFFFSKVLSMV